MTKRNVIISSFVAVAIAVVAIANMGTARFTVIVLDEQTRRPIEDVDVIKIADNQGTFAYDLMESAWLPPLGNGKHADIEFTCLPRERLPDGNNGFGGTAHRYKNSIQVAFPGQDNGICAMPSTQFSK